MADYNINIKATDNASGSINKVQGGLAGLTAGAGKFKAALGAAAAGFAALKIGQTIQGEIDSMDALAKSARAAGAAAENDAFRGFQVMKQALAEAGVDAGTADRAFLNISQRMKEGQEGADAFSDIFEKLKGNITGTNGELKSSPQILQEMINALNEGRISTDEFKKVVGGRAGPVINELFGKMQGNAQGLADTLKDVEANTNIVSLDASQNAEVFNDTMERLSQNMGQLMTDAITPLLPMLVELAEGALAALPAVVEKVQKGFELMQPAISAIGTIVTDVIVPALGFLFENLGKVLNAVLPLIAEKGIPALKAVFEAVQPVIETAVTVFNTVWEAFQNIFDYAAPIIEESLPLLQSAFDAIRPIIETVVGFFVGAWEALKSLFEYAAPVYETALPMLREGFEMVKGVVESLVAFVSSLIEKLQGIADKAAAIKDATVGKFNELKDGVGSAMTDMGNGITSTWNSATDSLNKSAEDLYQRWWGGSIFPDLRDGVLSAFRDMATGAISETNRMATGASLEAEQFSGSIQENFVGTLESALSDGKLEMGEFRGFFQNTMQQILRTALTKGSGINNALTGMFSGLGGLFGGGGGGGLGGMLGGLFGGGGGGGGLFSGLFGGGGLGGLFGGFLASGGPAQFGTPYVVGEKGPELFVPNQSGTVVPNGAGGGANVVFNIQAIDTQSGTQFLLDNKQSIVHMIQQAGHKRGKEIF